MRRERERCGASVSLDLRTVNIRTHDSCGRERLPAWQSTWLPRPLLAPPGSLEAPAGTAGAQGRRPRLAPVHEGVHPLSAVTRRATPGCTADDGRVRQVDLHV